LGFIDKLKYDQLIVEPKEANVLKKLRRWFIVMAYVGLCQFGYGWYMSFNGVFPGVE